MKPIKCIVVDDEDLAIDIIAEYIKRIDQLELVGMYNNAVEALQVLNTQPVDLIFLDIQMPGLTGLEMIRSLPNHPEVIFTTAYTEYALEGFELEAMDYLVKPISFERFVKSVNRFFKLHQKIEMPDSISSTAFNDSFIFVKADKMMVKVVLKEIAYIESLRNYVSIYLTNGQQVKTMNTLSNIEEKLPESHFLRIHRSFIIAVDQIDSYTSGNIKIADNIIPIGRNYKEAVAMVLNKNSID
ncbi:MAG: LytTR family DNA-binding domain-containing protein [Carboxylicivirga sp.]|jgi:DNA-binding LytR/AlgR family response regulator|nr:LytTR family DNA-binding domain-containing protein [Carboxylicivirga sp.]